MQQEGELWPRAASWLQVGQDNCDLAVLGVPAHKTSISETAAHQTPQAIRAALTRYSLSSTNGSIASLKALDFGDVVDPDSPEGESRTRDLVSLAAAKSRLLVALGGDNSITYAVASGVLDISGGLITLDAHHDIRTGISNGSPVRRLIEEFGISGKRIVQLGINDFSNSPEYAHRAKEYGIHVISRAEIAEIGVKAATQKALELVDADTVHVDFDVDVCDRSFVPASPASAPGGISAFELRSFARYLTEDPSVKSIDITEIDAAQDAADGRTVRLGALLILEAAAGLLAR
ncbi:MAG: agmatinase family protein [Rhodoluna sp.]